MIQASPTKRKRTGAYYTPPDLAQYLVRWAIRQADDRVVEPACGEAIFLSTVVNRLAELRSGEPASGQLVGYELNPEAAALARQVAPSATVIEGDFFDQQSPAQEFDAVVGNPPYVRYHYFAGLSRERGLARARAAGVSLSGLTSSWAPFVVHAATFLGPSGRLALVLPAELLGTDYAAPVREFLLRRFATVDVVTFETRVFPEAMVDAVLLLAEGTGPGQLRVHRLADATALAAFTPSGAAAARLIKWTDGFLDDQTTQALFAAAQVMVPLGYVASVDIGIVTGANRFFVLTDNQANALELETEGLQPVLARAQQLRGYELTTEGWESERAAGAPIWLFTPARRQGAAGRYIDAGEDENVNAAYKCRVRNPWWRLKLPSPPDLLLNYMSNQAPRLVANSAGVRTTNLIHNVRLNPMFSEGIDPRSLALAWTNSASLLSAETVGRAYGGGVLKLETREAERVLLPRLGPTQGAELRRIERNIDQALRAGDLERAADLIDPIVLADLSLREQQALRRGWRDLRARRKQRSAPARTA